MKKNRDAYVQRLSGFYEKMWENSKLDYIKGYAKFIDTDKV